ncbi:hypothetical protein Anas_03730 [Armadillidium nasatum]|uniref:Uncharacterized protein n=1 Tax=Armadillidium nasatum TaxID=96803 RepID=A0A5N5TMB4_9CRUS|nr:hypothetical protein Anas_03730 [Armadillidium nasatum]
MGKNKRNFRNNPINKVLNLKNKNRQPSFKTKSKKPKPVKLNIKKVNASNREAVKKLSNVNNFLEAFKKEKRVTNPGSSKQGSGALTDLARNVDGYFECW